MSLKLLIIPDDKTQEPFRQLRSITLAAKAFLLSDILRILTPEEISHLTTTSSADSRMPLTEVISKYQCGQLVDFSLRLSALRSRDEEDNVVKFDRTQIIDDENTPAIQCGPKVAEFISEFGTDSLKGDAPGFVDAEEQDSSSFILSEKRRFEQSNAKIRSKDILKMYKQTAAVDLATERSLKEDLSKSSQVGILVDRKQA